MAEDTEQQPIIVKRIKKGHGGHHGGAWKVAFADFMTAMMAFFMVMWLVGQKPEVREAVGGYFRDPGKFQREGAAGVLKGSNSVIPRISSDVGLKSAKTEKNQGPTDFERIKMKSAAKKITQELEKQEAFHRLKNNVKMQMTSEGLRIILNESEDSPAFFEPGSAKLLQKSAVILITIARELGQLSNKISIEGHTDSNFSGSRDYTNWELSTDRANAARALMEVSGLKPDQVREVRGYADRFPMIMNNPADPRNRRVTLLVLYKSSESTYDQIEVGADLMAEIEAEAEG